MPTKRGLFKFVRRYFLVAAIGLVTMNPMGVNAATTRNLVVDASSGAISITETDSGGAINPAFTINIGKKDHVKWTVKTLVAPGHTHLMVLFNPKHFLGTLGSTSSFQTIDGGTPIEVAEDESGNDDDYKYAVVVWDDSAPAKIYYMDPTIRVGSGNGNNLLWELRDLQAIRHHVLELKAFPQQQAIARVLEATVNKLEGF